MEPKGYEVIASGKKISELSYIKNSRVKI
jgi:hypothetical protein